MRRLRTKNRPKANARRIFPAPLALVLGLVAVLSVTYLWLCGRCEQLGQEIKRKPGMAFVRQTCHREQQRRALLANILIHANGRLPGGLRHREHLALLDRRQLLTVAH